MSADSRSRPAGALVLFAILAAIFLLHAPLLRLPYFWDEAGYYVPAARDLFLSGSVIPHSTPSNAHPPLVMAYLAGCWKVFGFSPLVTRSAMLGFAAFSLLGVFRLAQRVANLEVAIAATACTAPVMTPAPSETISAPTVPVPRSTRTVRPVTESTSAPPMSPAASWSGRAGT